MRAPALPPPHVHSLARAGAILFAALALAACGGGGGGSGGPTDLTDPKAVAKLNCEVGNLAGENPEKLKEIYKNAGLGDDLMAAARKLSEAVAAIAKDPKKQEAYQDEFLKCLK